MKGKRTIIVGAGIAGLTLAYLLCRDGYDVLVVEKEPAPGGLARSFTYDGFVFDIGPHRFHTDYPEVRELIENVLDDDCVEIERKSGVWMFERYFEWPLTRGSIRGLPFRVLLSVAGDFLKRRRPPGDSFEDYIINRYGRTLYEMFFRPYTEKFIKVPCAEVSRDWAVTGIDRAVIDKKIRMDSLTGLVRSVLSPRPPIRFLYPRTGGIQVFAERQKEYIERHGGTVLCDSHVQEIRKEGATVKEVVIQEKAYACDQIVWTAPITEIVRMLGHGPMELEYLALLLYNYRIDHEPLIDFQWCYYGSADIPFNRISIPSLFNSRNAPAGSSGLCVEVTCRKGDHLWNGPDALEPEIRTSLGRVGVIRDEKAVIGCTVERIPNTYPVYTLDYRKEQDRALQLIGSYSNVKVLGRTGSFWYNNMDHSIRAAIKLCDEIKRIDR